MFCNEFYDKNNFEHVVFYSEIKFKKIMVKQYYGNNLTINISTRIK